MKLACLFSGGKDSCLALHLAVKYGNDIKYLLNVFPENKDSWMFHKPDLKLLKRQADELGIKLVIKKSKGEEREELEDLKNLILEIRENIEGIVTGGIASSYQGTRIKKICDELGLEFIAPLWNVPAEKIWQKLFNSGFEVVLTKIACDGIGKEWIGRVIERENFNNLKKLAEKYKFRLDFEGGEAETAVLWMPGFEKHIKIDFDDDSENKYRHFMRIKKII